MTTATTTQNIATDVRDEVIPFAGTTRRHTPMAPDRVKNAKAIIRQIKGRETKTKTQINEFLPEWISGVHGGDNIALINSFLGALGGDRRRLMALFLREMVPYSFKDGQFTKKGDKAFCAQKLENFNKFLDSGQTVYIWIDANTKSDTVPPDYAKRAENALARAVKHGVTPKQLLDILNKVVAENAEEAQAKAA